MKPVPLPPPDHQTPEDSKVELYSDIESVGQDMDSDDDKELVIAEDHTSVDPTTSAEPTDGMFWLFNDVLNTVINFLPFDSNRIPKC